MYDLSHGALSANFRTSGAHDGWARAVSGNFRHGQEAARHEPESHKWKEPVTNSAGGRLHLGQA